MYAMNFELMVLAASNIDEVREVVLLCFTCTRSKIILEAGCLIELYRWPSRFREI